MTQISQGNTGAAKAGTQCSKRDTRQPRGHMAAKGIQGSNLGDTDQPRGHKAAKGIQGGTQSTGSQGDTDQAR